MTTTTTADTQNKSSNKRSAPNAPRTTATTAHARPSSRPTSSKLLRTPNCRPAGGAFPEYNREELAREIGCDPSALSYILRGMREPLMDKAARLARALGVSLETLNSALEKERQKYQREKKKKQKAA